MSTEPSPAWANNHPHSASVSSSPEHAIRRLAAAKLRDMGHKDKALRLLYCRRVDEHGNYPCHLRWLCPECLRAEQWSNKIDAAACASFALMLAPHARAYFVTLVIPPIEDPALQAEILRTVIKRLSRVQTGSWGIVEGAHWFIEPGRAANGQYLLHLHATAYAAQESVERLYATHPWKGRWHHVMLRCKMRSVAKQVLIEHSIATSAAREAKMAHIRPLDAHLTKGAFATKDLEEVEPVSLLPAAPGALVADAAQVAEYAWAPENEKKRNRTSPTLSLDQKVELQLADLGRMRGRNGVLHNIPDLDVRREGERADLMLARYRSRAGREF